MLKYWPIRRTLATSFLGLLVLFAQGCQSIPFPIDPAERPSGSVLFQDDFSDPGSGWDRQPGIQQGFLDYFSGVYRIRVDVEHMLLWTSPGLEFTHTRAEVDAMWLSGPQDNNYGIVCRAQDRENFYFLAISSDGYYGIGKVRSGEPSLIGAQAMLPSENIQRGEAKNHLRADCIEQELSLYVNGVLLAREEDTEFSSGEVGLMAGTFGTPGTEVFFDNFTVLVP